MYGQMQKHNTAAKTRLDQTAKGTYSEQSTILNVEGITLYHTENR